MEVKAVGPSRGVLRDARVKKDLIQGPGWRPVGRCNLASICSVPDGTFSGGA